VLDAVEALEIPHEGSPAALHVTVSIGIACHDGADAGSARSSSNSRFSAIASVHSASELLAAADRALYAAKRAGRAQAKVLDVSDVDAPMKAQDIAPAHRSRQTGLGARSPVAAPARAMG
jgi:predicted signal transduction protein with EAL and GGDEF domain